MKNDPAIPPDKKLTLLYRLEPGCLGPSGKEYIEEFCRYAQEKFATLHADILQCEIVPRHDKSLAEIQYKLKDRLLAQDKVAKYLSAFNRNIEEIEDQINSILVDLINQYMSRE